MLWRKARIWESLRASGVNSIFGPFGLRPFPCLTSFLLSPTLLPLSSSISIIKGLAEKGVVIPCFGVISPASHPCHAYRIRPHPASTRSWTIPPSLPIEQHQMLSLWCCGRLFSPITG